MNTVIGDRAFHRDPTIVITLAKHYIAGMKRAGMQAVAKHFPGHGNVTKDSHVTLPVDQRAFSALMQDDLRPFQALAGTVAGIMSSHLLFPAIDSKIVGFSQYWLKSILRDQLQFKGVILSDDLHMEGANISQYAPDRFLEARVAGCDLILYCNDRQAVVEILDAVPASKHQLSSAEWRSLAGIHR
jgi:beta-N-acetylhexosaminidase